MFLRDKILKNHKKNGNCIRHIERNYNLKKSTVRQISYYNISKNYFHKKNLSFANYFFNYIVFVYIYIYIQLMGSEVDIFKVIHVCG